ncbi:MAG: hypothetical protein JXB48_00335 [Candidatus Latescibacteria bacterium]|nr:hypothetical protein [Candidatus Latescibacterota bacterium]
MNDHDFFKLLPWRLVICPVFMALLLKPSEYVFAQMFDAGLHFNVASPQGKFKDNVDRNGYGISIEGLIKPSPLPIRLGIDFGFLQYGRERRSEHFSQTIQDVSVDVTTSNNIVTSNIFLRLQQDYGVLMPYIDGVLGLQYLYTETTIEDENHNDEPIASSKNIDDLTFCRGVGGGVMVPLHTFNKQYGGSRCSGSKLPVTLILDFKVRYMYGGKADYLTEGSIDRSGDEYTYNVSKSETDLLYFRLGLLIRL